ncbi:histidine triad nucleotide-binding protein [Clostridium polynesiense]|uniref:histidine triad nucleotide-binding protein n=1 Tax=Clostridium polynesiense TaxID=1325933 RepID=UPI00059017E1|nr:histidine triad nucleotide-binding protein [Clostridium polynesiense]
MNDCIFCKIVEGDIPSKKIYEDDKVLAFQDIKPEAPVHVLIIPKAHIESVNNINEENSEIIGHIFLVINKLAKTLEIEKDGYRVVNNCGVNGGQTVPHLHFHLFGGKSFNWPPL